jgi:hypothetical protein
VAELADALGSGSSGRKAVRVQIPPSAPKKYFSFNKLSRLTLHNHCHQTVIRIVFVWGLLCP